jgi:serine/threonine protein kinase
MILVLTCFLQNLCEERNGTLNLSLSFGVLFVVCFSNTGSGQTPLDQETRSRIALGAARGIEYIHSRGREICDGSIKSSNILLTRVYNAGVSYFRLAQLVSATPFVDRIVGYRSPEVTDARKNSQKVDVYSFVVLLEILTRKAPSKVIMTTVNQRH